MGFAAEGIVLMAGSPGTVAAVLAYAVYVTTAVLRAAAVLIAGGITYSRHFSLTVVAGVCVGHI